MFTTPKNRKCPIFTSRDPRSIGNAVWVNRSGIFACVFSPLPLFLYMVRNMRQTSLTLILVAPTLARHICQLL